MAANLTVKNQTINTPLKSTKAIVLLFTKNSGRADSEEFIYPNINEIKMEIGGKSNKVYSDHFEKYRFYDEALRLLGSKDEKDQYMTPEMFYKDKFALVNGLRSIEDIQKTGNGVNAMNDNKISLQIKKSSHTGELKCYTFLVYDGVNNIIQKRWMSFRTKYNVLYRWKHHST